MAHPDDTTSLLQSLSRLSAKDSPLQRTMSELFNASSAAPNLDLNQVVQEAQRDVKLVEAQGRQMLGQLEQFKGLIHSMQNVNATLDFDQTIAGIMDTAIKLTHAERAYLVLEEAGQEDYQLCAARNWIREDISEEDWVFSHSVVKEAIDKAEPVLTVNASDDDRFSDKESILVHQLRSILCLPLILRQQVIGAFYLDNKSSPGIFDEFSIPVLSAFANQAALAIDHARQYSLVKQDLASTKEQLNQLERLMQQTTPGSDRDQFNGGES